MKNESRRVSPFPCFSLTHRSQFTSLRVAPHDTQSFVLCNQMREHEQVVPWCNWLALRTLNPAIRVQISVGPSFLPSFLFASVNHSLTITTHMRFGVTCVSFFPSMMQTRNPAISTSSLSIRSSKFCVCVYPSASFSHFLPNNPLIIPIPISISYGQSTA